MDQVLTARVTMDREDYEDSDGEEADDS